jgi:hypothetical protein
MANLDYRFRVESAITILFSTTRTFNSRMCVPTGRAARRFWLIKVEAHQEK